MSKVQRRSFDSGTISVVSSERLEVAETEHCPYCVLGDHFRLMLKKPGGWLICTKCGHTAMPASQDFRCFCRNCGHFKRAA